MQSIFFSSAEHAVGNLQSLRPVCKPPVITASDKGGPFIDIDELSNLCTASVQTNPSADSDRGQGRVSGGHARR